MLFALPLALAVQVSAAAPPAVPADTGEARPDSSAWHLRRRRIPLTPALLASAYHDAAARDLITRARVARLVQDSSLLSYDATSKQRMTVGIGFRETGRERMLFRTEGAARVRWQQGRGVRIDVLGARTAFPMVYPGVRVVMDMLDDDAIPYYPGREGLLHLAGVRRVTQTDEGLFIHPLDEGAEAYYRYRSGDSVVFRLPDGRRIRLREVTVIAREPTWDLIVGSLWFDVASAHLVRAVFRPAAPVDVVQLAERDDPHTFDDVPRFVRPMIFPMTATITAFTVEYGLHDQRWWLPRLQTVEARGRMGFTRFSFTLAESFRFASVNGTDTIPRIEVTPESDSLRRVAERARRDSLRAARRAHRGGNEGDEELRGLDCPLGDTLVLKRLHDRTLPVAIHVPCDTAMLAHSPELPPSIYASGEETFDLAQRDELVKQLGLSLQPGWHPLPPTLHYGLDRGLLRYNRVEGLSAGIGIEENFGSGVVGEATARIGVADWEPNVELHVRRSNGRRTIGLGVYRRLESASDWGDPFSLGSSVSALLFARDYGFYYRSWGAELLGSWEGARTFGWRAFAEHQWNAPVATNFSLPNLLSDREFRPNLHAARADAFGLGLWWRGDFGLDPHDWRLALDARAEGATGTFDYARGALDATLSRGIARVGDRWLDGALTAGAGTSAGSVPAQRLWYLGGVSTVRGHTPGTAVGDAYWFGRAELGYGLTAVRPALFFDLGWAGARERWTHPGRPISGAGVGLSVLDGLMRLDVAKGIHPDRGWRVELYLEGRF